MFRNLIEQCSLYFNDFQYGAIIRLKNFLQENEWDFLTDGTGKEGGFSEITENVKEVGFSFTTILKNFAYSACAAAVIMLGIGLLFGGQGGRKREEKKEQLPYTLIGICCLYFCR